jgi:hypothetical protein
VMAGWTLRGGGDITAIGDQGRRSAGSPIIGQLERCAGTNSRGLRQQKAPRFRGARGFV